MILNCYVENALVNKNWENILRKYNQNCNFFFIILSNTINNFKEKNISSKAKIIIRFSEAQNVIPKLFHNTKKTLPSSNLHVYLQILLKTQRIRHPKSFIPTQKNPTFADFSSLKIFKFTFSRNFSNSGPVGWPLLCPWSYVINTCSYRLDY